MESPKNQDKILEAIKNGPLRGLYIKEIAEITHLSRTTVSRYVGVLEAHKLIIGDGIGNAKLFQLVPQEKQGGVS